MSIAEVTNTFEVVDSFVSTYKEWNEGANSGGLKVIGTLPNGVPLRVVATISKRGSYNRYTQRNRYARVYVGDEGETLLDNLLNRNNREWTEWKKHVLPTLVAMLPEMQSILTRRNEPDEDFNDWPLIKIDNDKLKVRWDKHAGCEMCACSSGFVLDGVEAWSTWEELTFWLYVGNEGESSWGFDFGKDD